LILEYFLSIFSIGKKGDMYNNYYLKLKENFYDDKTKVMELMLIGVSSKDVLIYR
jgi:hypothetical protein